MAFVLRIKFPPTYPLIYKTLRVDSELSVEEAITFIGETLHVPAGENIGLYIPQTKQWLDSETPLKEYPILEDAVSTRFFFNFDQLSFLTFFLFLQEEIEFKDKNAPDPEPEVAEEDVSGSICDSCTLM